MSSILRALKKLENDPRRLTKTTPLDSKFGPLPDAGPQKKAARPLAIIIGGVFICSLAVLAGWWMFSEKNQPLPAPPQKISGQSPAPTAAVPAKQAEPAILQPATAAIETPKPVADTIAKPKPAIQPPMESATPKTATAASPASAPGEVSVAAEKVVPDSTHEPAAPEPETAATTPAEPAESAAAEPQAITKKAPAPEIPVLNDPDMRLQAITWSKEPQKRLVILNNHILRQGETVSGYRIDRINQDDVVLSKGGEKWQLMFRIK
jgi:general secretion pathway protein B